jgi:lipoate-protein ligase A
MNISKTLSPYGQMKLIDGPHFIEPEDEIRVAPKILRYSIEKSAGTFARIYRPQPTVALTSRDSSSRGYEKALLQAKNFGFKPVIRSPGGRAVAYHEESLVLYILSPDPDPHQMINERFMAIGKLFLQTLDALGISSELGQLPREFCPGKYSVISNDVKLVGTAQRIMHGGWLIGASIIVSNVAPIREVLTEVYHALEIDMNPGTIGALNEYIPTISVDDFTTSLVTTLKDHFEIMEVDLLMNIHDSGHELANA